MEVAKTLENGKLNVKVTGRLDTITAPQLQSELENALEGITALEFDFSSLEYISSAGLRVLLSVNKKMMRAGGEMSVKGANAVVKEVFEMTGFIDIFNVV